MQSVIAKMNKLQAVVRANGNPRVRLRDMMQSRPRHPSQSSSTLICVFVLWSTLCLQIGLDDVLATPKGPGSVEEARQRLQTLNASIASMRNKAVVALGGSETSGREVADSAPIEGVLTSKAMPVGLAVFGELRLRMIDFIHLSPDDSWYPPCPSSGDLPSRCPRCNERR